MWSGELDFWSAKAINNIVKFFVFQLTGLPTTSGAVGTKAAPKQAVAADADADLQARLIYLKLVYKFYKIILFSIQKFLSKVFVIFLVFFYQKFVQGNAHKTAYERNYGKEFCFTTSNDRSEPRAASNAIMRSAKQSVRQKHVIGSKRGNLCSQSSFAADWLKSQQPHVLSSTRGLRAATLFLISQ